MEGVEFDESTYHFANKSDFSNRSYLEISFQQPSKLLVRFLVQIPMEHAYTLRILSFLLPGPGLLYHENAVSHPLTQSIDETMSSPGHHASVDMCCCWVCVCVCEYV